MSSHGAEDLGPEEVEVLLQRLDPAVPIPGYAYPGDAGADLVSRQDIEIRPLGRATIGTGLSIALPPGYVGLVHPRSGLAASHGVTVLNAPGTVDAGYRGEIMVTMHNTDPEAVFTVRRGDRIAQLVIQRVSQARFVDVRTLPGSHRGALGFGSSGVGSPDDTESMAKGSR